MGSASLTKKGPGLAYLKQLKAQLAERPYVKVGLLGQAGNDRGEQLDNVQIGAIQEFGAPEAGIPSRPFLRGTFDAQKQRWGDLAAKLLKGVVAQKISLDHALGVLGEKAVADIRTTVRKGIPPPNAPRTIRAKGSSKPLIDTGRMVQSISHQVKKS